jgi:hypothetical protein
MRIPRNTVLTFESREENAEMRDEGVKRRGRRVGKQCNEAHEEKVSSAHAMKHGEARVGTVCELRLGLSACVCVYACVCVCVCARAGTK